MANSQNTTVSIDHNYDQLDPLTMGRNTTKYSKIRAFIQFLVALMGGGMRPGAVMRIGTVAASGTVTYSSGSGTQTIVLNGVTVFNQAWATSDTATATAAAAAVNASVNALVQNLFIATSALGVVTIRAVRKGLGPNSYTFTGTGTGATFNPSGGRLTGGTETVYTF